MIVLIKRGKLLWAMLDRAPSLSQFARMANVSPSTLGGVLRRRRCKMVRFTFKEEPARYSTGSGDFLQLWNCLMEDYGKNVEQLQEDLKAVPERVKIWKVKTKSKKTYTKVKSLEAIDNEDIQVQGQDVRDEGIPLR